MIKLIILDRDGVINTDSDDYIRNENEWEALPGSLEAIARLNRAGYRIVLASNQSGLGRGKFNIHDLNAIHRKMHTHLAQFGGVIDAVFFCPHTPEEKCSCRKPKTALFDEISRRLRVPLYKTTFVGDKLSDMQAALTAKANPVLVKTGDGQSLINSGSLPDNIPVFEDLSAFVDTLLAAA